MADKTGISRGTAASENTALQKEQEAIREAISEVDAELLPLLNRRAALSLQIGSLKRQAGLPVHQPERELRKLAELGAANSGPLDAGQIATIYERIFEVSRALQK